MTRKSRREIARRIDELESSNQGDGEVSDEEMQSLRELMEFAYPEYEAENRDRQLHRERAIEQ